MNLTTIKARVLKLFILVSILIPVYFVYGNRYFPEFVLANFIGIIYCVFPFGKHNKNHNGFILVMVILLIIYNGVSLYINLRYLHWVWEQINVTAAYIFFLCLLRQKQSFFEKNKIGEFTIGCIFLITIVNIVMYFRGYLSFSFANGVFQKFLRDPSYYEKRFYGLFIHKSGFAFMNAMFIAFIVSNYQKFKNKIVFYSFLSLPVLAIVLSNTYTTLFASMFIFAGFIVDKIAPKIKTINKKVFLWIIPITILILFLVYKMAKERSVLSLGGRIYIWRYAIDQIKAHPHGVGASFGGVYFYVQELKANIYNCHNVFLNEMFRFSFVSGLMYTLMFFSVCFYSLREKFSFFTIGTWICILICFSMDYCIHANDLALLLFLIYCVFFLNPKSRLFEDKYVI